MRNGNEKERMRNCMNGKSCLPSPAAFLHLQFMVPRPGAVAYRLCLGGRFAVRSADFLKGGTRFIPVSPFRL